VESRRLYRLKAETLLIWGRQDRLVDPAYGPAFASAIANARLELIDNAGHVPQIEQCNQVVSLGGRLPRLRRGRRGIMDGWKRARSAG
jgi:pimeloyl-ACP methyl ester carboxylesterase